MTELLVATTNAGKFAEIQAYLAGFPLALRFLSAMENRPTVIEDGATFEQNALKKARTFARWSGLLTLADDSGLEVDALDGAPGIYSARYCGEEGDDEKNNKKLLRELENVPVERRTARYICALALCAPESGKEWLIRESCEGRITSAPVGAGGFGYDPLFFFAGFGLTFGQVDRETKATVSHRGKALKKLAKILSAVVDLGAKP